VEVGTGLVAANLAGDTVGVESSGKTPENQQRAPSGQAKLPPGNHHDTLGRFRHRLLSGEVVALTLIGVIFAAAGALGFAGIIHYSDWKRKVTCGAVFGASLPLTAGFYGWAISGRWDGLLCLCFA